MAGSGSPCGACKFLRRKCVSGCVFAPYFCHQQGAAHFAAIHKVFGASNASKLLLHLPVSDRLEAAFTISYEARARLLDPIYGCVAHIFALVLQVLTLEAQLTSLKAQKAHSFASGDPSTSGVDEDKLSNKHACYEPASDNKLLDPNTFQSSQHCGQHLYMDFDEQFLSTDVNSSCAMASLDLLSIRPLPYRNTGLCRRETQKTFQIFHTRACLKQLHNSEKPLAQDPV